MIEITHENTKPIICIGGANVDRKFYLKDTITPGSSNPVNSSHSIGGVARNIAENLGRLGEEVILISAAGDDLEWREIERVSAPFMNIGHVRKFPGQATGSYTAVLDQHGDLAIALADMDVFDEITVDWLSEKTEILKQASCIIIDLNCPKETVESLRAFSLKHAIPLVVIPVSSPKMARLPKQLNGVTWLIVNKDETETFLDTKIDDISEWKKAVESWLALGVENVIVTSGVDGVTFGNKNGKVEHYPSIHTPEVIDVTGAGDSFCSAVIHTWLQKKTVESIIHAGLVNAHKTILSKHTVRQDLSAEQLKRDMEEC